MVVGDPDGAMDMDKLVKEFNTWMMKLKFDYENEKKAAKQAKLQAKLERKARKKAAKNADNDAKGEVEMDVALGHDCDEVTADWRWG